MLSFKNVKYLNLVEKYNFLRKTLFYKRLETMSDVMWPPYVRTPAPLRFW